MYFVAFGSGSAQEPWNLMYFSLFVWCRQDNVTSVVTLFMFHDDDDCFEDASDTESTRDEPREHG